MTRKRVYISYAAEDAAAATRLSEELRKLGLRPWMVDEQIFPGDNVGKLIGEAIETANAVVVLVSPDALSSPMVQHELMFAFGRDNLAGRVFPVMVKRTPDAKIPAGLRMIQISDGKDMGKVSKEILRSLSPGAAARRAEAGDRDHGKAVAAPGRIVGSGDDALGRTFGGAALNKVRGRQRGRATPDKTRSASGQPAAKRRSA
jgi:hypothetical protein